MKYISWNVNGIRAVVNKSVFLEYLAVEQPDVMGLHEVKCLETDVPILMELRALGYEVHWHAAARRGYSGTAILSRIPTLSVERVPILGDDEGRVIAAEYHDAYFVTVYTPNAKRDLSRLAYRETWDRAFAEYLRALSSRKPVIVSGDLNVAHEEIDLTHPAANRGNAGFTDAERRGLSEILAAGFVDTYRARYPDRTGAYTWWSNFVNSRAKNVGWRIDYMLVSEGLAPRVTDAFIRSEVMGSDHCPVGITVA